jgi:hypothetical protein
MTKSEKHELSSAAVAELEQAEAGFLDELEELKARIEAIKRDWSARLAALRITRARMAQSNPDWLAELRAQYTDEVARRTEKLNNEFPVAPQ